MKVTRRSRTNQQSTMPHATAATEWKIRVLSSSRCSRKLIDGIRSSSAAGGSSRWVSGIVGIVCGIEIGLNRATLLRWQGIFSRRRRYNSSRRFGGQNLSFLLVFLLPLLVLKLADFGLDLRFEFVGGAFEFV